MIRCGTMEFSVAGVDPVEQSCDLLVVGVYENGSLSKAAQDLDCAGNGILKRLVEAGDLSGKLGDASMLIDCAGIRARRVIVTGLGKAGRIGLAELSEALSAAIALLPLNKRTTIGIFLTSEEIADASSYYVARCVAKTVADGLYHFSGLKSVPSSASDQVQSFAIALRNPSDRSSVIAGLKHGQAIADGMSVARDLSNLPPNICTPDYIAKVARTLARRHNSLRAQTLSESQMKKLGMNALLSVSAGSARSAKLLIMKYDGGSDSRPVVLVGKGVTFDSGGISLKPADGMSAMKFDMAGAAAVLGVLSAIAVLEAPINLVAVLPLCENMPGGGATRPGDVIRSMSGQTIEIVDTDGEGRLILCDAMTYARRFRPAVLIDVATLTGAVAVALGSHYTAVMGNDDCLVNALIGAGASADDPAWRMPVGGKFEEQLESPVADLANVASNRHGAACVAGSFLATFVRDLKWAHLDTGGTGWPVPNENCATGRPVSLLVEYLLRSAGTISQPPAARHERLLPHA